MGDIQECYEGEEWCGVGLAIERVVNGLLYTKSRPNKYTQVVLCCRDKDSVYISSDSNINNRNTLSATVVLFCLMFCSTFLYVLICPCFLK